LQRGSLNEQKGAVNKEETAQLMLETRFICQQNKN